MYVWFVCSVTIFCMQTYATHVKVQCLGMLLVIGSEPTYVVALVEANNSKSHLVDCLYVVSLILLCNQLIPLTLVIFLIVSHSSGDRGQWSKPLVGDRKESSRLL